MRFLLLQVRDHTDPMREQEIDCFAETLRCERENIGVHNLLEGAPERPRVDACDIVLLGGSGDYSVVKGGPWLAEALEALRELETIAKPTFASCWGFQAMALALGGEVVTDLARAEVGTVKVSTTADGRRDPLFEGFEFFGAQMGHQDVVTRLPETAVRLASSALVQNQAFRIRDKPIYCTQFHPELSRRGLLERVRAYPVYIEKITGMPYSEFVEHCRETPESAGLLRRFAESVI